MPLKKLPTFFLILFCSLIILFLAYYFFVKSVNKIANESTINKEQVTQTQQKESATINKEPEDSLKKRLQSVAQQYKHTLRYPEYSSRLSNKRAEALSKVMAVPQLRPYRIGDLKGQSSLVVTKFDYHQGDTLKGSIQLNGDDGFISLIESVKLEINQFSEEPSGNGHLVNLDASTQSAVPFELELPSESIGEHVVTAVVKLTNGESHIHTSPIEIFGPPAAILHSIQNGVVVDNELHFLLKLETHQQGFYRLNAQIYSENGDAIASLQESFFTNDKQPRKFRLSGLLLKDLELDPPFTIKNIKITHIPSVASERLTQGTSIQSEYTVNADVRYTDFKDKPHTPSKEIRERIEFMESIGNK